MRENGRHHGLKELIQRLKDDLRRLALRESGKAANVTEEERSLSPLAFLMRHQTTAQQLPGNVLSHVRFEQLRLFLFGQRELVSLLLPRHALLPFDEGLDADDEIATVA